MPRTSTLQWKCDFAQKSQTFSWLRNTRKQAMALKREEQTQAIRANTADRPRKLCPTRLHFNWSTTSVQKSYALHVEHRLLSMFTQCHAFSRQRNKTNPSWRSFDMESWRVRTKRKRHNVKTELLVQSRWNKQSVNRINSWGAQIREDASISEGKQWTFKSAIPWRNGLLFLILHDDTLDELKQWSSALWQTQEKWV